MARAPRALYLNYLARRDFATTLAPDIFRPLALEADPTRTLFSILVFELEGARPAWAPHWCSRLAPRVIQSNWRFYGAATNLAGGERPGVLIWRTLTDSRIAAFFGGRVSRALPVERVSRMRLRRSGDEVSAAIEGAMEFCGRVEPEPAVPEPFRAHFGSYREFARSVMDQRLAVTIWEREVVVQGLRLGVESARILPLEPLQVQLAGVEKFVENPEQPLACFLVEDLDVQLNAIRRIPRKAQL
ncbi:MAG: hypothetical protein ACRD5I_16280 [Candidatus Acidiferrales bacterium]